MIHGEKSEIHLSFLAPTVTYYVFFHELTTTYTPDYTTLFETFFHHDNFFMVLQIFPTVFHKR